MTKSDWIKSLLTAVAIVAIGWMMVCICAIAEAAR